MVIDFHPQLGGGWGSTECDCSYNYTEDGNSTEIEESGYTTINIMYIGKFHSSHIVKNRI